MITTMESGAVRLRLSEILKERGMSQTELANKTGLSKNAISQLCRKPCRIGFDTIEMLIKALDIPLCDLFEVSGHNSES